MDHDTLTVFLPCGIMTTSRGGPLGAINHESKKGTLILTSFIQNKSNIQDPRGIHEFITPIAKTTKLKGVKTQNNRAPWIRCHLLAENEHRFLSWLQEEKRVELGEP